MTSSEGSGGDEHKATHVFLGRDSRDSEEQSLIIQRPIIYYLIFFHFQSSIVS